MEIRVNNISYFLEYHQQEPTLPSLLMLHGFMGSGRAFKHLINPLSRFCNPITIDLLGHGQTQDPGEPERYAVEHQLHDLFEIIAGIDGQGLFLHGYSMGGRLALRFAIQNPDMIKGLILESTNYGIEEKNQRKQRMKLDEERVQAIETDFEEFLSSWHKLPIFKNGTDHSEELVEHYKTIQQNQRPCAIANSLRGFGTAQMPPVKEKLQQLNMPVLLLAGEADTKYRDILDEMDQLIPKSKHHIIKDAGHRIHLENPAAFVDQVQAFIFSSSCNR
ncbi:2-succinyl-6-hydroxy-2,4-cyclohexadiene-1-carboxylate synthase [Aliifodinibius sp. S!AR15-10]|uniref:2-succinyl-6-hydroxy-2, 4-cyclohexadiene-1-carboxylate synthase n=1 Tax=Aliifodinibius sp. S!AR15-10 TaxID=2950437 RepID=UPI00285E5AE2|nr:2-succinyl-6-hydroxy-2,4-cyclohexadiene-1-carboxylate synthase [Aliifodinibius sp. S!AR15-10]MDR8391112.1 2-succinyl-6-hydroxy-2,4-cyclohexadiene-1-carboxylate synthase [Aliifodinibius sp. S!AR15-10]